MGTPSRKPNQALSNNKQENVIVKKKSDEKIPTLDNKLASSATSKEISEKGMSEKETIGAKVEIKDPAPIKVASKDVKGMIVYLYLI